MLESQWVWQCTKSVSIPAEEQNAGLIVDYFYRMEFHITPRFFSDSNYLFFFFPVESGDLQQLWQHNPRQYTTPTIYQKKKYTPQIVELILGYLHQQPYNNDTRSAGKKIIS